MNLDGNTADKPMISRIEKRNEMKKLRDRKIGKVKRWIIFTVLVSLIPILINIGNITFNDLIREQVLKSSVDGISLSLNSDVENTKDTNVSNNRVLLIIDYIIGNGVLLITITCFCATAIGELVGKDIKEINKNWSSVGGCFITILATLYLYSQVPVYSQLSKSSDLELLILSIISVIMFIYGIITGGICIYISEV